jgi:hypothetical protein
VGEIQQSPLLPEQVPAKSRGTDFYRQTVCGNEVTSARLSSLGAAGPAYGERGKDYPRSECPRESRGIKEAADVGTVCCGIEVTSKGVANAAR